jgi:hypothetical protein
MSDIAAPVQTLLIGPQKDTFHCTLAFYWNSAITQSTAASPFWPVQIVPRARLADASVIPASAR